MLLRKLKLNKILLFAVCLFLCGSIFVCFAEEETSLSDFDLSLSASQSILVHSLSSTWVKWRVLDDGLVTQNSDVIENNTLANFAMDSYISVYGQKSIFLYNSNAMSYNWLMSYAFYDSSKTFISGQNYTGTRYDYVLSVPDDAYYFRCSIAGGKSVTVSTANNRYFAVTSSTPVSDFPSTDTLPTYLIFDNVEIQTRGNVVQTVNSVNSARATYLDLKFEGDISFIQQLSFDIGFFYDNNSTFVDLPLIDPYIIPYTIKQGTKQYLNSFPLSLDNSLYHFNLVSSASTSIDGLLVVAPFDGVFSSVLMWSTSNWIVNDETIIVNTQTSGTVGNLEQGSQDLESLAQGLEVPKPNINDVMNQIDDNLSVIDSSVVSEMSSLFPNNGLFSTIIVLVLTFALLSFVLFGKKHSNG